VGDVADSQRPETTVAVPALTTTPAPGDGADVAVSALAEVDGETPPGGFTGEHPDWGDRPFSFDACANW
jgi:hypothetical protein